MGVIHSSPPRAIRTATEAILRTWRPACRQRPSLRYERAVEVHEQKFSLNGRDTTINERLLVVVALQPWARADVDHLLVEANVPRRKRRVVGDDLQRVERPTVDHVAVVRQLVLQPTVGEVPVARDADARLGAQKRVTVGKT